MKAEFLPSALSHDNFLPLTSGRQLADCPVANATLHTVQTAELETAGLGEAAEPTALTLYIFDNAWIDERDLNTLGQTDMPVVLQDVHGDVLAWTAAEAAVDDTADLLVTEHSLLLRHSWDLLALNARLLSRNCKDEILGDVADCVKVDGTIRVGAGTRILPGTYIEGNVVIGKDCKIGPNCYLRGPTAIGSGCHVGNAVEIKASILMDGVSIGHLSYVGDSIIGCRTNFGAGTITANLRHDGANQRSEINGELVDTRRRKLGAVIGDDVHTGINTSIYPGRKLWPGVSTLPGEIVKCDVKG